MKKILKSCPYLQSEKSILSYNSNIMNIYPFVKNDNQVYGLDLFSKTSTINL